MLFEPSSFVTGTIAGITALTGYIATPIIQVGFGFAVVFGSIGAVWYWLIHRATKGAPHTVNYFGTPHAHKRGSWKGSRWTWDD